MLDLPVPDTALELYARFELIGRPGRASCSSTGTATQDVKPLTIIKRGRNWRCKLMLRHNINLT